MWLPLPAWGVFVYANGRRGLSAGPGVDEQNRRTWTVGGLHTDLGQAPRSTGIRGAGQGPDEHGACPLGTRSPFPIGGWTRSEPHSAVPIFPRCSFWSTSPVVRGCVGWSPCSRKGWAVGFQVRPIACDPRSRRGHRAPKPALVDGARVVEGVVEPSQHLGPVERFGGLLPAAPSRWARPDLRAALCHLRKFLIVARYQDATRAD